MLLRPRECGERHRDRAELQGPEEYRDEVGTVGLDERDPIPVADIERPQRAGGAILALGQGRVAVGLAPMPDRRRGAAAGGAGRIDERAAEIERG